MRFCGQPGRITSVGLLMALLLPTTLSQSAPMIHPIAYSLPAPPVLVGTLSVNNAITNAEKVHEKLIKGPNSFVNHDGHLYASTVDNKIYDLAACPPRLISNLAHPGCASPSTCGQTISLRRDPISGYLLALDSYRGLYAVHPLNGRAQLIFSTSTPVNGRPPVHLNDMVVSPDGVIMMTDSSDAYNVAQDVYICMDGRPTGRLIAFYPQTGLVKELLPGHFNFPNGLELTPDGDLLVGETCRATIHRVSLKRHSWLQVHPFTVNLPGLPDNIRSSGRGTYWVAMSYPRHSGILSPLDQNARIPEFRAMGFEWMSLQQLREFFPKWATIVEVDAVGSIIGSLHDPKAHTLTMVTEVNEFGGILSIGSHLVNYMTRILLPPESGVKTTVEGFIQVKRSRCQLPDSQVEETRRRLLQQQNQTSF